MRSSRLKQTSTGQVRVIRDVSDARKDFWIDPIAARNLYNAGHLGWDLTNKQYCTTDSGLTQELRYAK